MEPLEKSNITSIFSKSPNFFLQTFNTRWSRRILISDGQLRPLWHHRAMQQHQHIVTVTVKQCAHYVIILWSPWLGLVDDWQTWQLYYNGRCLL